MQHPYNIAPPYNVATPTIQHLLQCSIPYNTAPPYNVAPPTMQHPLQYSNPYNIATPYNIAPPYNVAQLVGFKQLLSLHDIIHCSVVSFHTVENRPITAQLNILYHCGQEKYVICSCGSLLPGYKK